MAATAATPTTAAGRYVGQSVQRREDPRLVSGRGRYVDDLQPKGLLHAAFVRSHVARGTITRVDTSAARALEGVVAVYTADDVNPVVKQWWYEMLGPPPEMGGQTVYPPTRPLAQGDVRFVGDPIAIVIATDRYVAEDACDLVEVDIDPLTPILDVRAAAADTVNLVNPELGTNTPAPMPAMEVPVVDEVFRSAAHVVTRSFHQARATNVPMEPRGLIAQYDRAEGDLQIWAATQSPHGLKHFAARMLGLTESRVRVTAQDVGGGFGQKMMATRDEGVVIIAAYLLGNAPVKWIEDRRESLIAANQAREEYEDVSFALDADGKILAVKVHFINDNGALPTGGAGSGAGLSAMMFTGPYKIPMILPQGTGVLTNRVGAAAYRGPWAMESICREQMIDHCAFELGIDPVELRRRNIVQAADLPYTTATQMVYDHMSPSETLEQALEILGYEQFRREQAEARAQGRLLGVGISVYVEPSAVGMGILGSEAAIIRIDPSGKVQVMVGTGSHGHSVETTIAQVVAESLGVNYDDVQVVQGDTSSTPLGAGTGGSRTAVIVGGAAQKASAMMREKIATIGAHLLEASPDDIEITNSFVSVRGTPTKGMPLGQIAALAYQMPDMLPPGTDMGLEVVARYTPGQVFTWSNATHICVVEVDPETGIAKILRYIVSEDCGRMINPMVVEGQITGGVVQGIGGVLYEHLRYDDDGNPLTTTFLDYLVPTADTVPDFEIGHVVTDSPTLGGFKGMGEGGAIGAPAAVANAVHDALAHLGVHPTDFPLGPSQIIDLLAAAR